MNDPRSRSDALARSDDGPTRTHGADEGACLVCGEAALVQEHGLPPGQLRCDACRAINDVNDRSALVPGSGELLLRPVAKPPTMAVSVEPMTALAGSPYRHEGAVPSARVVVRWRERADRAWIPNGVPTWTLAIVVLLYIGGAIAVLFVPPLLAIVYVLVSSGPGRFELVASGERVELVRKGLVLPPLLKASSRHWYVAGRMQSEVRPQTFSVTRPEKVRLFRRTEEIDEGQTFDYYGIAFIDENGHHVERAISTNVDEARFVFRVTTGFVPGTTGALAPAAATRMLDEPGSGPDTW